MRAAPRTISPVVVLVLTVLWLILNESLAPRHVVLGAALGVALAWTASRLRPLHARLRRLDVAAVLLLVVAWDVVRGNVEVARIVLGLVRGREVRAGFLGIPLELRDPHGLAVLAMIVTATPGTVWAGLAPDGSTLTLHVLDLRDEAQWIRDFKDRYELRLRRIFE